MAAGSDTHARLHARTDGEAWVAQVSQDPDQSRYPAEKIVCLRRGVDFMRAVSGAIIPY